MPVFTQIDILQVIGALLMGVVAVIYSSAGFGGGSSYISLMALMNLPYQTYPTLALFCNLIVVTASAIRFIRNKMVVWNKILPWIILSVPMAFVGGLVHLPENLFIALLATLLFFSGVRILMNDRHATTPIAPHMLQSTFIGGILGLISGIVGIGGGIFLSPIMTYWKMDTAKNVSIATTLFIFFNSLSALMGKLHNVEFFYKAANYWPLLFIVFIGGQIGNHWCVYKATDKQLTILAGSLAVLASFTLVSKIL